MEVLVANAAITRDMLLMLKNPTSPTWSTTSFRVVQRAIKGMLKLQHRPGSLVVGLYGSPARSATHI